MRRTTALLLLVPLATGCEDVTLQDFMPSVNFQRMEVTDIDFEQIEADFVFSVDNPNPVQVGLSSFSYGLSLAQVELLSGGNEEGFQLEAVGSSELLLPVGMGWTNAWDTVDATRGEDYIDFGLDGHFGFDTPLGEARVGYREDGDFPALRTPKFDFDKIRVTGIDPLTQVADLEFDIAVDNAHRSTLFFDSFDYTIRMEGSKVADGLISELGGVEGAENGTLTVPLSVDLLDVSSAVYSAIVNKEPLNARLKATMDVDTPFGYLPLSVDESGRVSITN